MSITFTLVQATSYRMRYLCTNGGSPLGGSATLPNDGGATPDLLTDLAALGPSPLRSIITARTNGIGTIAAGALTQAQARALLMSDNTASVGNNMVPRAITEIIGRTGSAVWSVDANVDGQGDPVLAVTSTAVAGDAYLDIKARHSIDF